MALKKSDMELPHLLRNMEAKVVRDTEPTKEKESHPRGCCNHQSSGQGEDKCTSKVLLTTNYKEKKRMSQNNSKIQT